MTGDIRPSEHCATVSADCFSSIVIPTPKYKPCVAFNVFRFLQILRCIKLPMLPICRLNIVRS